MLRKAYEQDATQTVNLHYALLGCADHAPDPLLGRWLSDPLAPRRPDGPHTSDNLQHGACSVADRLVTASRKLNQPKLHATAQRILGDMANHASSMGGYQTIAGMPRGTFFPGFCQGLSGIGYTLLRNQADSTLPCVQLWD